MSEVVDAVVLLSGGVDSMVLLWRASNPVGLFVDYGQAARWKEREAAVALCKRRGCRFATVEVDGFVVTAMNAEAGVVGPRVVYGRNLLLVALGANLARSYGAQEVWLGCHAGDGDDYGDCRPEFISSQDRSCRGAYGVGVRAPLLMQSRASFVAEARMTGALGLTWSCYAPAEGGVPCGGCNSCRQQV